MSVVVMLITIALELIANERKGLLPVLEEFV